MKFHDILGVSEKASVDEIQTAYLKKVSALSVLGESNAAAHTKRLEQLDQARDAALNWNNMTFSRRVGLMLSESASKTLSSNRMYSCIGPFSCIDGLCSFSSLSFDEGCCHQMCGAYCGMYADVALYVAGGIALVYCAVSDSKRKAELREDEIRKKRLLQQEEEERRKQERKHALDDCIGSVRELMGNFSPSDLEAVSRYLNGLDRSEDYTTVVNYTTALSQVSIYKNEITSKYEESLSNKEYFDALSYLGFLSKLEDGQDNYRKDQELLQTLCSFLDKKDISVAGKNYGSMDDAFAHRLKKDYDQALLPGAGHEVDFESLLWSFTLADPFNIDAYKTLLESFPVSDQSGKPIVGVIASLLYIKGKHYVEFVRNISLPFDPLLKEVVSEADSGTLYQLASIACAAGNIQDERFLLYSLYKTGNLPTELEKRYSEISVNAVFRDA